jgi:hypothetical protein
VAWKQICRPKDQGGFGFLDLSIQIRLSCSRISTNFTTSMMYLGCSWSGILITQMEAFLETSLRVPFGGEHT